ncbi:MAG: hypothetical protein V9H69_24135 [Anaerolineae bacterium]
MEIELHLNASAQQVAGRLFSLRPDGPIAGWDVAGYYAKPNKAGTAITLSIVASLRRPGDADAALVSVQVRELAPARSSAVNLERRPI